MIEALLAGLVFIALAPPVEGLARPRRAAAAFRPAAWSLRLVVLAPTYCFWLAATAGRPWFALAASFASLLALVLISNAKRTLLGEPVVFADFALLPQALRHPRLYHADLLGEVAVLVPLLLGLAGAGLWLAFEPARLALPLALALFAVPALALAAPFVAPLRRPLLALARRMGLSGEAERDVAAFGLLATIAAHLVLWREDGTAPQAAPAALRTPARGDGEAPWPHIVAVQSESFVDLPGRTGSGAPLVHFPRLAAASTSFGRLLTPASGAYTMRTEHAFLTGRANSDLGLDRYNPYLRRPAPGTTSLPAALAAVGYRTVFIHPHDRRFFARHRVIPALGFDTFLDERDFAEAERAGRYVSDAAMAARIERLLAEADRPLFVYAVTIENHGPWRAVRDGDRLLRPEDVYRRHLDNADAMLGRLADALAAGERQAILCFFGDHAPALPVFADREAQLRTDYLLAALGPGFPSGAATEADLAIEALPQRILTLAEQLADPAPPAVPARLAAGAER